MTQLATIEASRGLSVTPGSRAASLAVSFNELTEMAQVVVDSRLWTMTLPQATALMLICHSRHMHPMEALARFHIMEMKGRSVIAWKAEAMLAEFQARGGRLTPLVTTTKEARGIFYHPYLPAEGFEFGVTIDQFRHLSGKDVWQASPQDMLWARLITKGIRKVDPGILLGIPMPDDVEDANAGEITLALESRQVTPQRIASSETTLPGQVDSGHDTRPYPKVVTDAVEAVNRARAEKWKAAFLNEELTVPEIHGPDLHRVLWEEASALGHVTGAKPSGIRDAIKQLATAYQKERTWVRDRIQSLLEEKLEQFEEILEARGEQGAAPQTAPMPTQPEAESAPAPPAAVGPSTNADESMMGWLGEGEDTRDFLSVVANGVSAVNRSISILAGGSTAKISVGMLTKSEDVLADLYRVAINEEYVEGPTPSPKETAKRLTALYGEHRAWVRNSIQDILEAKLSDTEADLEAMKKPEA